MPIRMIFIRLHIVKSGSDLIEYGGYCNILLGFSRVVIISGVITLLYQELLRCISLINCIYHYLRPISWFIGIWTLIFRRGRKGEE